MIVTRWAWFVTCVAGLCGCGWLAGVKSYGDIDSGTVVHVDGAAPVGSPPAPTAMFPWNGYYTGAYGAPASRTPTFSWSLVDGATYYTFAMCEIQSPQTDCMLPQGMSVGSATTFTPSLLDGSTTAPVGARWVWSVGACNPIGCNSSTRYLNVGRLDNDFNGTGAGQLAVGANDQMVVTYGGPSLAMSQTLIVNSPGFGERVSTGDFDGDGFADLVIYAAGSDNAGALYEYRGGGTLELQQPVLQAMSPSPDQQFGQQSFSPGDLDGDGYDDLVVVMSGSITVFRGSSAGLSTTSSYSVSALSGYVYQAGFSVGDVDGDGYPDFLVSSAGTDAVLFFGPLSSSSPRFQPIEPVANATSWAQAVAGGDLNGDGFSDVVISGVDTVGGIAYEFLGSAAGLGSGEIYYKGNIASLLYVREASSYAIAIGATSQATALAGNTVTPLLDPSTSMSTSYGSVLGDADFTGNGNDAIVVGAPDDATAANTCGAAYVFRSVSGAFTSGTPLDPPVCGTGAEFGIALTQ
jgi:FG-GAP-like repeat/FG-GAP repeat